MWTGREQIPTAPPTRVRHLKCAEALDRPSPVAPRVSKSCEGQIHVVPSRPSMASSTPFPAPPEPAPNGTHYGTATGPFQPERACREGRTGQLPGTSSRGLSYARAPVGLEPAGMKF